MPIKQSRAAKTCNEFIRVWRILKNAKHPLLVRDCSLNGDNRFITKCILDTLVVIGIAEETLKGYKCGKGYKTNRKIKSYILKRNENKKSSIQRKIK